MKNNRITLVVSSAIGIGFMLLLSWGSTFYPQIAISLALPLVVLGLALHAAPCGCRCNHK